MLIYITGGARSGKSRLSVELAQKIAKKVTFVATCMFRDPDMLRRIKRHRQDRPKRWKTIENRMDLPGIVSEMRGKTELLLIDCLTMYISKLMMDGKKEPEILAKVERLCKTAAASPLLTILVSNEVGSSLHAPTEIGRKFCDTTGRANQIAARYADTAYLMVSGLPITLKGGEFQAALRGK